MGAGETGVGAEDPHAGGVLLTAGPRAEDAAVALVLVHGRGGEASGMLDLYRALGVEGVAAVAPQAAGHTWYPQSFLSPLPSNQPYLDSALARLGAVVEGLGERGVPAERVALLGFSQGACLVSEFVARNARRYAGVMVLTGGLIGPAGTPRAYGGSLAGTPVFLGANDPDPHVPFARVEETREVLERLGGVVELRRYPGLPHTVNQDEADACRSLLERVVGEARR